MILTEGILIGFQVTRQRPALSSSPLLPIQASFVITKDQQMLWGNDNKWEVISGKMQVYVGGQQPMQNTTAPSNVLTGFFTMSPGP